MNINGGKLIGEGSDTCVFKPNIPCPGVDINKDKITKLLLKNNSDITEEIKFNKIISKIKSSDEWSVTLFNKCKSPKYKEFYKYDKDIHKCIKNSDNTLKSFKNNDHFMLYGDYGGEDMETTFKKTTLKKFVKNINNEKLIYKDMVNFMKQCFSLFYGISELHRNNIIHYDIKPSNITFINNKYKLIDYGISTKFSNFNKIKARAMQEYKTERIYPYYPYEILYLYASISLYLESKKNRKYSKNINNYHSLFKRNHKKLLSHIIDYSKNNNYNKYQKELISKLDTYSLGITIVSLLYKNMDKPSIVKLFNYPSIQPFFKLLEKMTEPFYYDRMYPNEAYQELISILNYNPYKSNINKKIIKKYKIDNKIPTIEKPQRGRRSPRRSSRRSPRRSSRRSPRRSSRRSPRRSSRRSPRRSSRRSPRRSSRRSPRI